MTTQPPYRPWRTPFSRRQFLRGAAGTDAAVGGEKDRLMPRGPRSWLVMVGALVAALELVAAPSPAQG